MQYPNTSYYFSFRRLLATVLVWTMMSGAALASDLIQSGRWVYLADTVMGGVSEGSAQVETTDKGPAIRLTGTVSTQNNGGFIQVRTQIPKRAAAQATGLTLRVKGNGERYFIHIRNGGTLLPWHYYSHAFTAPNTWTEISIPFSKFERSSSVLSRTLNIRSVKSIGVVAYGRDHQADIWVSKLVLY